MVKMKKIIQIPLVLFLLLLLSNRSQAETSVKPDFQWQVGEELVYSVKWAFVGLGSLRLQVLGSDTIHGRLVYHCRIYIDSNPSLPFVNIHDVYDSFIDAEGIYSHIFLSYEKKKDHILYTRYDFDYENHRIHIRIEKQRHEDGEVLLDSTAYIPDKVLDSLSMLFFARAMVKNRANLDVSVFAYNSFEKTRINFTGEERWLKIRNTRAKSYYLDGRLKFIGIAGVKEDFKGWFSPDGQSVPLKAKMKAFVGSVTIELKKWSNWAGETIFFRKD